MVNDKVKVNTNNEDEEIFTVDDLYSVNDIQRLMYTNTLIALRDAGFKEDVSVSYIRIAAYLLLNSIGAYGTFFVHIEKSVIMLKVFVASFFVILGILLLYEKISLKGALYRLFLEDLKVLVWTKVNWKLGTFDLYYRTNDLANKECYSVPLGELFYSNKQCDFKYFKNEMKKLKSLIKSNSKKTK